MLSKNTTLDMLRFPINKLTDGKKRIREKRLKIYYDKLEQQQKEILSFFEKRQMFLKLNDALKLCSPVESIEHSFKRYSSNDETINTEIEATYTFDENNSTISEGSNFLDSRNMLKNFKQSSREKFNPEKMKHMSCVYDTPGIMASKEVL
jgi:hypothetical protein